MGIAHWRTLPFLDNTIPLPLDGPFTYAHARAAGVSRQASTSSCGRSRCSGHGRNRVRTDLADSGERNLRLEDAVELHGLRVTSPLRTAWDLGRRRSRDRALSGLDARLRPAVFDTTELVFGVPRCTGMQWVTVLRELAPLADGRSESPGESVLRLRWIDLSLPTPRPQVPVGLPGGRVVYLDLGNEEARFEPSSTGSSGGPPTTRWRTTPCRILHDGLVEARRRFGAKILHARRH